MDVILLWQTGLLNGQLVVADVLDVTNDLGLDVDPDGFKDITLLL